MKRMKYILSAKNNSNFFSALGFSHTILVWKDYQLLNVPQKTMICYLLFGEKRKTLLHLEWRGMMSNNNEANPTHKQYAHLWLSPSLFLLLLLLFLIPRASENIMRVNSYDYSGSKSGSPNKLIINCKREVIFNNFSLIVITSDLTSDARRRQAK